MEMPEVLGSKRVRYIFAAGHPDQGFGEATWLAAVRDAPELRPISRKSFRSPLDGEILTQDLPLSFGIHSAGGQVLGRLVWREANAGGYLEVQGDGAEFTAVAQRIARVLDSDLVEPPEDY